MQHFFGMALRSPFSALNGRLVSDALPAFCSAPLIPSLVRGHPRGARSVRDKTCPSVIVYVRKKLLSPCWTLILANFLRCRQVLPRQDSPFVLLLCCIALVCSTHSHDLRPTPVLWALSQLPSHSCTLFFKNAAEFVDLMTW